MELNKKNNTSINFPIRCDKNKSKKNTKAFNNIMSTTKLVITKKPLRLL
jgi:hypothetical protein